MAMIEVTALSKYYGKYMSIEQVSFSVEKGEIFGIVGAEDAGKTTVLDILAGAVKPSSGKCVVCGLDVQENAQQVARMLRVVSQSGETYSKLRAKTVDKYLKGISQDAARQRAQKWCAYFGISENDVIRKMSKQNKTALYMIDVLLGMPRVLMLDAPFEGADQEFIAKMSQFLANENKRGLTVILTARSAEQIAHLCTRMVTMQEGRLFADEAKQAAPQMEEPVFDQQDVFPDDLSQYDTRRAPVTHFEPLQQDTRDMYQQRETRDPMEEAREDARAFEQMRRDFYAQNTVRQPAAAPRTSRNDNQDMFRQMEDDFFSPQAQQEAYAPQHRGYEQETYRQAPAAHTAPSYEQDPDATRRFSMSEAYAARNPQREDMQQTRSYPAFDQNFSRGYAAAPKQPAYEQEAYRQAPAQEYTDYRTQEMPRQDYRPQEQEFERPDAYEPRMRGAHSADYTSYRAPQRSYQQESFYQNDYAQTDYAAQSRVRGAHAKAQDDFSYSRESEPARMSHAYEETQDFDRFQSVQGAHARAAEYERPVRGAHAKAEDKASDYEAPRAYSQYKGAHAQTSYESQQESAYEGRNARSAHAKAESTYEYEDRRYSAQGAHSRRSTEKAADYTLYSSHHNASVHMPAVQGNRRIMLVADNVPMDFLRNIGATGLHKDGDRVEFFFNGQMDKLIVALSQMNVRDLRISMDVPVNGAEEN